MKLLDKIISRFRLAFLVGADMQSIFTLLYVAFVVPILKKLGKNSIKLYKVTLTKFKRTCTAHIRDGSDIAVLYEMFVEEQYSIDLLQEPKVIFDLGSNTGISVLYFKLKYPNAHVYACEADPKTVELLEKNTIQFDNMTVYPYAVGPTNGVQSFYVNPSSSMSSSLIKRGEGQQEIKVEMRTFDALFKEAGVITVDLLKFDIEGTEYELFKNFDTINYVTAIIGEIHMDLINVSKETMLGLFQRYLTEQMILSSKRFIIKGWKINSDI